METEKFELSIDGRGDWPDKAINVRIMKTVTGLYIYGYSLNHDSIDWKNQVIAAAKQMKLNLGLKEATLTFSRVTLLELGKLL